MIKETKLFKITVIEGEIVYYVAAEDLYEAVGIYNNFTNAKKYINKIEKIETLNVPVLI